MTNQQSSTFHQTEEIRPLNMLLETPPTSPISQPCFLLPSPRASLKSGECSLQRKDKNLIENIASIKMTRKSLERDLPELVSSSIKSSARRDAGKRHRTRYIVALLGLLVAVVNCYAQATFCIAIVEMVLPSDYVFKNESSQSVVKVLVNANLVSSQNGLQTSEMINIIEDNSCPIQYKYREYYDSWRFPTDVAISKIPTNEQQQQQASNNRTERYTIDTSNRFDWDASRQGLLLGAFAIGTAPLQVLGGRLAEIYGAKWVLLAGCVGTALTNLSIPMLAHFSFVLLLMNRILMGVSQAGLEPGLMCLLAEWLTPAETGFFISMLLFAMCTGFFLGSLGSSFLLTCGYDWSYTYYVSSLVNLIVALLWLFYASSRPKESNRISAEELEYIEYEQQVVRLSAAREINDLNIDDCKENISQKAMTQAKKMKNNHLKKENTFEQQVEDCVTDSIYDGAKNRRRTSLISETNIKAPWLNILKTPSVWAFIICKFSIRWCADVMSIELPTYLANVLHLSIKLNGILNSVSSALFAIFSFITGYLVNELLKSQQRDDCKLRLSKTTLRKLTQSVASFGSAIAVFLMTQYDCNIMFSMTMLLLLSCCVVVGTGGELQIPYDMTSRYPGTLHGMACTLSVSGWLAPPLIGLILGDQPSSRYRWSLVWYLTALINLVGGLVFVLFADASPRDFDRPTCKREGKEEIVKGREIDGSLSNKRGSITNRGRHLASYYNLACKQADTSPPPRSVIRLNNHFHGDSGCCMGLGSGNGSSNEKFEEGNPKPVQQPNDWSYFDRELIRIRQTEESFNPKLNYPYNFDSIASQGIIFPYQVERHQMPTATDNELPVGQLTGVTKESMGKLKLKLKQQRHQHLNSDSEQIDPGHYAKWTSALDLRLRKQMRRCRKKLGLSRVESGSVVSGKFGCEEATRKEVCGQADKRTECCSSCGRNMEQDALVSATTASCYPVEYQQLACSKTITHL